MNAGVAIPRLVAAALAGATLCAPGCISQPPAVSAEQRAAIETRQISGQRDRVLQAAASTMLDEGFLYAMSDHEAGLLGGLRVNPLYAEGYARRGGLEGHGAHSPTDAAVVWARAAGPEQTLLRIQLWAYGRPMTDPERVSQIAAAVERRLLAAAPSAASQPQQVRLSELLDKPPPTSQTPAPAAQKPSGPEGQWTPGRPVTTLRPARAGGVP